MVNITVFFEGGDPLQAFDNTEVLRQSFNKLLNAGLKEKTEVQITAIPLGSVRSAPKQNLTENDFLLIDLDSAATDIDAAKQTRLNQFYSPDKHHRIFFMVQAMEAWILSQPQVIEKYYDCDNDYSKYKKVTDYPLEQDPILLSVDVCSFHKPESQLDALIKTHFRKKSNNGLIKYGKLKTAPDLIALLDIERLQNDFVDVKNLLAAIP